MGFEPWAADLGGCLVDNGGDEGDDLCEDGVS